MRDIWIVCRKELKELLSPQGNRRGSLLRVVILCGVLGLVMPLAQKDAWIGTSLPALFFIMVPLPIASGVILDSFAGERERGTLETLLATRLSNRSILLGKVLAVVIYAWAITMVSIILSLVGVNLTKGSPGIFFYSAIVWVTSLPGSFLFATLMAGMGVLISLKAKSVRSAQQTLSLSMIVFFFAVGFGLPALARMVIPATVDTTQPPLLGEVDLLTTSLVVLSVVAVLDAFILFLALRQFKRAQLILE